MKCGPLIGLPFTFSSAASTSLIAKAMASRRTASAGFSASPQIAAFIEITAQTKH